MQFNQDQADAEFQITGYADGQVNVGERKLTASFLISANWLDDKWPVKGYTDLTEETLQPIIKAKPELVILGYGQTSVLPDPQILAPLYQARIGFEVMTVGAACRTYSVCLAEGRAVVAGFIL